MAGPAGAGSIPRMRSSPALTGDTAATILIVEDLPAPLGPRKPNASPRRTSTSMPRTASTAGWPGRVNDLRSPTAEIIAPLSVSGVVGLTGPDPSPAPRQGSPGKADQPFA